MDQIFAVIGFILVVFGLSITLASLGGGNLKHDHTGYVAGSVISLVGVVFILAF